MVSKPIFSSVLELCLVCHNILFGAFSGISQYPVFHVNAYATDLPSLKISLYCWKQQLKASWKHLGFAVKCLVFFFFFNSKSNSKTSEKSCYFFDKKQISFKQCIHFWEFVNPRRLFIIFANYFRYSVFSTLGKACLSALRQLEKHLVPFYLLS